MTPILSVNHLQAHMRGACSGDTRPQTAARPVPDAVLQAAVMFGRAALLQMLVEIDRAAW